MNETLINLLQRNRVEKFGKREGRDEEERVNE